ncbi:MAG: hypothetical protein AB7Q17_11665 [Phycisphaerae bacterium]
MTAHARRAGITGLALIAGFAGGILGAALWALLSRLTSLEIGYVAWAVGLLVGLGATRGGGAGPVMGGAAAAIALAAIVAGKLSTVYLALPVAMRELYQEDRVGELTAEQHAAWVADAAGFAALRGPDEHARFMLDHGFTPMQSAAEITAGELDAFRRITVPVLRALHAQGLDHAAWRAMLIDRWAREATRSFGLREAAAVARDTLGPLDLVFAVLGLVTAYQLPAAAGRRRPLPT